MPTTAVSDAHPNPVCCYCRVVSKVASYADDSDASQDSEFCSNPDRLRHTHSDISASLNSSSSGDSDDDDSDSDSATQSEGGGHQHSSSRKAAVVRARKVSSERVKRAPRSNGSVRWTDEMVCNLYTPCMCALTYYCYMVVCIYFTFIFYLFVLLCSLSKLLAVILQLLCSCVIVIISIFHIYNYYI